MTIKVYPSRMPGQPLEIHEHGEMTFHEWMLSNVKEYRELEKPPIAVEIGDVSIPHSEWPLCFIKPESDIRIYPVPFASAAAVAAWAALAVAAASAVYVLMTMSNMDTGGYSSSSGRGLDLNPAKANTAKLGDPIREVFGRYRIYPDYVVQPVTRFDATDPTKMTVEMFICLGYGQFSYTAGDIRVGDTPSSTLPGFNYTNFPPGADVSGDPRSENWFNTTEVGGTSSGTGLDMAQTAPDSTDINADSMTVSGATVTFNGLNDDNDDDEGNTLPDSWVAGTIITLIAPTNFFITTVSGSSVLSSNTLEEINPFSGMPVTLEINGAEYELVIANYTPKQEAVPGVGGSSAILRASSAPSTYDFSVTPEIFSLTWQGITYSVSLIANYSSMSGLLVAINEGITGSGLVAQDDGGVVKIMEISSPWQGGSITSSSLPVSVFGADPVFTEGTASSGGSPAVTANVTLAYGSATGTAFSGVPEGTQRLSLAHSGNEYRIISTDGTTATIERLINGSSDPTWPGFYARTMIDYQATGINDNDTWLGPFLVCPQNEIVDAFEVNFSFPSGICGFDSKGKKRVRHVEWEIQYRISGTGSGWTSRQGVYALQNVNGLGYTERFDLTTPGLVEVRCRRRNEQGSNNARDNMYWHALRGRLLSRPLSYAGVTLMGVTLETGGKLAAQSDKRVNVVATRVYNSGAARSISGALYHVGNSLGLNMDTEAIDTLEDSVWTPNSEFFDYATSDSASALEMFQKITNAGRSYFFLSDGLASVGREGVKPWTGIISPHEMSEELQTAFSPPSDDDYDGVDVTYINGTTWAEETVQCRTSDNPTPVKIENYTLDGVLNKDDAYQIGMRRLMKYQRQRLTFSTTTELDALCYNYGDRILFTDDIPGNKTVSCLVTELHTISGVTTMTVTEALDWTFENPRAILRYQDGSASGLLVATQVGDYQLSVPYQPEFDDIILNDPYIEPPRLIFCTSTRRTYDALIEEIAPQSDGTCQITAKQYRDDFYSYDNTPYPGDIS
ncbi:host specificity factor TipJ family phage tail protein [Klebsiella oxytoca]|uniref:Kinase n=1 Tax=Klebsiella oxytoca TaxID=571 RepID=A0AAD3YRU5_KLEOX|nr:host specificity factor TipJ family phage tail protein [Klebsiella oxytoca]MBL6088480.1 kinase [Klebsiella oxytoca]MBL6253162.1 kinase [Klebsiella oxytoca]MBL6274499.1 kinase [Klebsiella oxytoca]MDU2890010.1 host specificity factor TipJ family phage tail protein [Klebsiella oxytoca]MEC6026057.1 host specificity factor TipJ family phage tail protein [Klebsiella oxytoca]